MKTDLVIRKISIPHCARGPLRCEKCKEMSKEKNICLLKIYFKERKITSPIIELVRNGKRRFFEFEVVKIFKDEIEARNYAEKNAVSINLVDKD